MEQEIVAVLPLLGEIFAWSVGALTVIFGCFAGYQRIKPAATIDETNKPIRHPMVIQDLPEEVQEILKQAHQISTDIALIRKEIEVGVNMRLEHLDAAAETSEKRIDKLIDLIIDSNR